MRTFLQREQIYRESLTSILAHVHRGLGRLSFWFVEQNFLFARWNISSLATERAAGESLPISKVLGELNISHARSITATTQDAQFNNRLWKNDKPSLHGTLANSNKRKTGKRFGAAGSPLHKESYPYMYIQHHLISVSGLLNRWN